MEETALRLALLMARFRQDAERIATLLEELDTPVGAERRIGVAASPG